MRAYLGVVDGKISVSDFDELVEEVFVTTREELNDALLPYQLADGSLSFAHSSSMDFPEEYTDDSVVLDSIEWIMGRVPEPTNVRSLPEVSETAVAVDYGDVEEQYDTGALAYEDAARRLRNQREHVETLQRQMNREQAELEALDRIHDDVTRYL